MSLLFHHRSIRKKFSLVVITASLIVLLLVSLLFGAIEYVSFRQKAEGELHTLAAILGGQLTKPLMEHKPNAAHQVLTALDTDSRLLVAYLFDKENKPLGQYLRIESVAVVEKVIKDDFEGKFPDRWLHIDTAESHFDIDHLSIYTPLFYQGKKIGGLYLASDLSSLNQSLLGLLVVVLLAGGAAVCISWWLSRWIHKPISEPILKLADTMSEISRTGNYHLRGQKQTEDEIGQMVDGFNDMLTQIEIRDQKIETHQKYLEQTVQERTVALTGTIGELEEARKLADSANQAKSVFLANMTHELRTPLVGVLGMNELLIETSLDDQQRSLAVTVQRSGQELLELINEILDFSKLEAGRLELNIQRMNLLTFVEETIEMLAERTYSKGLDIACRVDPGAAWIVEADSQRLRQILVNLLGNAIKFTSEGYVELQLTTDDSGNSVFIVADSGIGIDAQRQAAIFEAFSQVDSSTSRVFGGTGLGLSIVQDLTRMMNGSVSLTSKTGTGSRFQVKLPLQRVEPSFVRLPDERAGCPVVLCQPHQQTREALLQILLDIGFSAVAVKSQVELLQRLKNADLHANRFVLALIADTKEGLVDQGFVDQVQSCCRNVAVLRKKNHSGGNQSSALEISQPVLWSRLLKDDLLDSSQGDNLPAMQSVANESIPPATSADQDKTTILIVDDNVSTRELIGFSLAETSWQCDEAASAADALSAVERSEYFIILMDINMPRMDGIEATRIIRKRGVTTPIFALTAHGDEKIFEECLQAGMQGTLRKPFRQRELFALLAEQSEASAGVTGSTAGGSDEK